MNLIGNILSCLVLCVFIQQISGVPCPVNSICFKSRDQIVQRDASVSNFEKLHNKGRAWYIRPATVPTNALLAFRNFSSTSQSAVVVITYHSGSDKTTQYFYGDLGNFELLCKNAIGIIIYVPIQTTKTADFTVDYYTGCNVLTSRQEQIKHPQTDSQGQANNAKCWFVQPMDEVANKRIYFSIRNAALKEGQELKVWDVHTSRTIGIVKGRQQHQLFAAETNTTQSILIDLTNNQVQDNKPTRFLLSYYSMTKVDVECIEERKQCTKQMAKNPLFPPVLCDKKCPAFENMLMEEYELEAARPRVRSATLEENLEPDIEERNLFLGPPIRCPIPDKRMCNCPPQTILQKFCRNNFNCLQAGGCTFMCIMTQFMLCVEDAFARSLELL